MSCDAFDVVCSQLQDKRIYAAYNCLHDWKYFFEVVSKYPLSRSSSVIYFGSTCHKHLTKERGSVARSAFAHAARFNREKAQERNKIISLRPDMSINLSRVLRFVYADVSYLFTSIDYREKHSPLSKKKELISASSITVFKYDLLQRKAAIT